MIDLHTHTFYSDGAFGPAELARRCEVIGYRGLVISDHADPSNLEFMIERAVRFCEAAGRFGDRLTVRPGCEITHVPPRLIGGLVERARDLGAAIVLVHGETISEPVMPGTNRAAIEAGADVLAHPGLIQPGEVKMAAAGGVRLEISGRKGHCLTNGHVARLAVEQGATLSFGSDGHSAGDYPSPGQARSICRGAGLSGEQVDEVFRGNAELFERVG